jgi:hypothetical protein
MLRRLLAVLLVFAALLVEPTYAGGRKAAPKPKATPSKTAVTNVTATSVTIADDKGSKTLNVTPFTEVIVNGQKATLADVKPGMVVDVALRDPTTASRINAAASK